MASTPLSVMTTTRRQNRIVVMMQGTLVDEIGRRCAFAGVVLPTQCACVAQVLRRMLWRHRCRRRIAVLLRDRGGFPPGMHAEFRENAGDMTGDGARADEEALPDLAIRQPAGDQVENFAFPWRQAV